MQLAGGFVGDKALAVGEILHPERDLQQVVQLGAQPGIGAAATLLVLQQQGGFLFLAQFQRVGQVLQLELPRGALTAYNFVQRGAVDRRFAGQLGHCAGVAGDEYLQGLGQFAHGAASIYGMLLLYRESAALASVNFFGTSLRYAGKFVIIWESENEVTVMKKHPLLAAGAAAGTAVLGAAYAVYRVAFYQKPTTKVPSPADMPTRECYRKAMCPDADALARDMFKAVHITAQDGTPLAARYYHHADGAPLAIIFHGYRGYAERDGLGGYTLCTALGYNVLLPDQRAHGYSGGHTITMGVKERYDARDWTVWARSRFGPEVPIFLMGVSMGAATVLLAAGLNLPDNVCGIVADCGYTSPREITRKCLPEYLPGMPLELTYAVGRLGAILFGHFDPEDADCEAAAAQSKVPILFVHGDADGFVPYDMGKRNYEACRAKGKKFLTVHGAEHAVSYYHDNDAYTKQATEFLQDCLARRGFVWPPETDEPEK